MLSRHRSSGHSRERETFQPAPAGLPPSSPGVPGSWVTCGAGSGGQSRGSGGGRRAAVPVCPRVNPFPCRCRACLAEFHQKRVQFEKLLTSGWNSYCVWKRLGHSKPKLLSAHLGGLRGAGGRGARLAPGSHAGTRAPGDGGRCLPPTRGPHSSRRPSRSGGSRHPGAGVSARGEAGGRESPPPARPSARMPARSPAARRLPPPRRAPARCRPL